MRQDRVLVEPLLLPRRYCCSKFSSKRSEIIWALPPALTKQLCQCREPPQPKRMRPLFHAAGMGLTSPRGHAANARTYPRPGKSSWGNIIYVLSGMTTPRITVNFRLVPCIWH